MHEGIYLFKNGVDPYSGGVFYQVRSTKLFPNQLCSQPSCSLTPFLPHPLNPGFIAVSPLPVDIFDSHPAEPSVDPVIWTLVDAVSTYALVETWRARSGAGKSKRDVLLAALYVVGLEVGFERLRLLSASYLFNPYLFLPSLAFSTSSISNMFHLLSIVFAARGQSISNATQSCSQLIPPD